MTSRSRLASLILRTQPAQPLLPATHVTRAAVFLELAKQPSGESALVTSKCDVYGQHLLYFFYGRPVYGRSSQFQSTALPEFRPICLLLNADAIQEVERVVAVDSGALAGGLYSRYHGPDISLADFEIGDTPKHAARFVRRMFRTNEQYYLGFVRDYVKVEPTDLAAHAYLGLARDRGRGEVDDRRSTIEIQSRLNLLLSSESVLAVALPRSFLQNRSVRNKVVNEWKCKTIPYDIYHDSPAHDVREIIARVRDFLDKEGYFK